MNKCLFCKKQFQSYGTNIIFCSTKCNKDYHLPQSYKNKKKKEYKKLKIYETYNIDGFKSLEYIPKSSRKKQVKICLNCGNSYQTIHGFQKFCNMKCKQQNYLQRLGGKNERR